MSSVLEVERFQKISAKGLEARIIVSGLESRA